MLGQYRVAIAKADDIGVAVYRGIELMGGIQRYVRSGAHVVIKVNMFLHATPESAKVTHPAVVLEVARMCYECGARVSIVERLSEYAYVLQGYEAIEQVAELVSLEQVEHRHMVLPGARSLLCQVPWPNLVDACDVFINIPGLRTHALTKFSNGMKNLMGLLPDQATLLCHQCGLDGAICDLNYYRPSDLVVTDAVYTLEGNFPSEGSPVKTNIITVADNIVAADLVGATILGQDPVEVFYLQEAIRRGMGPASLSEIELVGDDLVAVRASAHITPAPSLPQLYQGALDLLIENACDSCRQALAGGLLAASHKSELAHMRDITIIAGHQVQEPQVGDHGVLIYGNCAYRYRNLGHYEPGCPPLAFQVVKGLGELRTRTIHAALSSAAWREAPIEQVISMAANAGYVGLETWAPHLERYIKTHGELLSLTELLRVNELHVPMISPPLDLASDPSRSLEAAQRYLGYAEMLDAPLVRVFANGGDLAKASIKVWRTVVAVLKRMCELGLDREIGLALEIHPDNLQDTTDSTLRLIRQVGMPNLYVSLDLFSVSLCGEDPVRVLRRLLPWVQFVRLRNAVRKGAEWQTVSLEEGDIDCAWFLGALHESNYGGYISIEWLDGNLAHTAVEEIAYLRRVLGTGLETRVK